jgi:hypothetical protein
MYRDIPFKKKRPFPDLSEAPAAWKPLDGSVISVPFRDKRFGRGEFRGNCDGTLFRELVLKYNPRRVADPMVGSGTTRDVVDHLNAGEGFAIEFWGGDLSNGFDLRTDPMPGTFDLVWVHPPYWDIIRFSDDPRDLSTCGDFVDFVRALEHCLTRCAGALAVGGRLAVLIGDVRKKGVYYSLVREVLNMMPHLGQLRSVIVKVQHACRSNATFYPKLEDPRILHEYCVLFKRCG